MVVERGKHMSQLCGLRVIDEQDLAVSDLINTAEAPYHHGMVAYQLALERLIDPGSKWIIAQDANDEWLIRRSQCF
jgi:hypothetical protein